MARQRFGGQRFGGHAKVQCHSAAAAKVRRFSSRTKVHKGLVAVRKVRRFNGAKVLRLHGHTKVQWPGRCSAALGAMVQRISELWFSAFVCCGSALIVQLWGGYIDFGGAPCYFDVGGVPEFS